MFIDQLIHSCICWLFLPFTFAHSFTHSRSHPFILWFICMFLLSFIHWWHSSIYSINESNTRSALHACRTDATGPTSTHLEETHTHTQTDQTLELTSIKSLNDVEKIWKNHPKPLQGTNCTVHIYPFHISTNHGTQFYIRATQSWSGPVSPLDVSSAKRTVYLATLDIAQRPASARLGWK